MTGHARAPWMTTPVTRQLAISLPIIQGPFGGGLSSVELTAAVSEAGGLGSFGAHHLGPGEIHEVARKIRARTRQPFALNLWLPFEGSDHPAFTAEDYRVQTEALQPLFDELGMAPPAMPARFSPPFDSQMEAVLEARPAVFSFVYGIPAPEVLDRCRTLGIVTIGTATSVEEGLALDAAGVDLIVASAFEAGGHRVAFLDAPERSLTGAIALIPQMVDAVRRPVIAAGGIVDGRGIAAAMMLGAQAVQIGTAFLACGESGTTDLHRARLFSADARHTVLTRVFSGRLARGIRNRLTESSEALPIAPYPVQNWLMGQIKSAAIAAGRTDLMSLWAGQSAPLLEHRRVHDLMAALIDRSNALLTGCGGAGNSNRIPRSQLLDQAS